MMSLSTNVKSVVLALAMIVAVPSQSNAQQAPAANAATNAVKFVLDNKALLSGITAFAVGTWIRLLTKPKAEYQCDQWKDDLKDLLESFNIFDTKLYKQLVHLFDKWFIGLEVKIEETATKTKMEDGSLFILKGKKLIQKPFGFVGFLDAYVIKQVKKTTELIAPLATFCMLLKETEKVLTLAATNATTK